MTILTYIYLSEYGIRQATATLLTNYKTVTVDPQKFGITEIWRCRNSGASDVKSANVACGESAINTQVTKIDTEILYIRNNLSVVFACHKTFWVSHGASPKYSVVRLRLIDGGHCQLFIQVERSKITRVTRLTAHCYVTVATQIPIFEACNVPSEAAPVRVSSCHRSSLIAPYTAVMIPASIDLVDGFGIWIQYECWAMPDLLWFYTCWFIPQMGFGRFMVMWKTMAGPSMIFCFIIWNLVRSVSTRAAPSFLYVWNIHCLAMPWANTDILNISMCSSLTTLIQHIRLLEMREEWIIGSIEGYGRFSWMSINSYKKVTNVYPKSLEKRSMYGARRQQIGHTHTFQGSCGNGLIRIHFFDDVNHRARLKSQMLYNVRFEIRIIF